MEAIGYLHIASAYEVAENIEVVPIKLELKFLEWPKLSSVAAMRLLSVTLAIALLNVANQAIALQQVGTRGTEVTFIQRCLKNLGYFNGPVTGTFANLTQRAVTRFQQAKGLAVDGVVGNNTRQALQQSCQSGTPSPNTNGQLREGSRGQAVAQLQQNLRQLGYFNGPRTGYFGSQTRQAVIRFQQASRIPANGIVDSRTAQALQSNLNVGGEYPVLAEGSRDPAVTRLQQRLRDLGYFKQNPTGYFGNVTKNAVAAFQRKAGIPGTGVANSQTWDALLNTAQVPDRPNTNTSSQQVRDVQQLLLDLGYYNGNVTGTTGTLTRDAIVQFQRDNGLTADGVVDSQLVTAVRKVWTAKYSNQNQPTRTVLSTGAKGENVRTVQQRLSELGYYKRTVDGVFGDYTRNAVSLFQKEYRINPTGRVDGQTWQALGFDNSVTAIRPVSNRYYVAAVPMQNIDTLDRVRRYVPNAFSDVSMSGNYVNAGAFSDRSVAENLTKMLRSKGLNARVQSI
ncbi:peptidoglycan-binding protein [Nostoc sp. FACHB-152]|uniref:peptidoglycan-binding domain-containing protein n=1 Tax=unclassified Nostoc TaxID=2593658 RepID=UPI001689E87D|nr:MULTISPECIES: peptidoglycan-binding protein [unclassified Nostoc]MBD2447326.1 peptidoglycan-binding protein [Nostoc sp. FACHB-152]MBD2468073.1 peptidoglycan-binding protein [Nostoc sp. FACHB-145]